MADAPRCFGVDVGAACDVAVVRIRGREVPTSPIDEGIEEVGVAWRRGVRVAASSAPAPRAEDPRSPPDPRLPCRGAVERVVVREPSRADWVGVDSNRERALVLLRVACSGDEESAGYKGCAWSDDVGGSAVDADVDLPHDPLEDVLVREERSHRGALIDGGAEEGAAGFDWGVEGDGSDDDLDFWYVWVAESLDGEVGSKGVVGMVWNPLGAPSCLADDG